MMAFRRAGRLGKHDITWGKLIASDCHPTIDIESKK